MSQKTPFTQSFSGVTEVVVTMPLKIIKYWFFTYTFQQWSDGNTNNVRTITVDDDMDLTAFYKFTWFS